jgi:DNA polymerase III delta prime subunit
MNQVNDIHHQQQVNDIHHQQQVNDIHHQQQVNDIHHQLNESIPWVEKYRPSQFEDIVLDPMNRSLFKNIIDKNYFPNLLFYGPPGTGKTTTIINLINEHQTKYNKRNKSNIIHLNASDERGIDIIRNQINQFVKSMNLFESGLKFVILDEVDYMTKNAQQALKYLLQTSTYNVRFCLICNYISKIDESLKNEFISVRFNQLPKIDVYNFLKVILTKENIELTDEVIDTIQKMYNSDIRSMINFIQLNQNLNLLEWNSCIINTETLDDIVSKFKDPDFTSKQMNAHIHDISIRYNIDKKTIINVYFNHIIRNQKYNNAEFIELLKVIETILHCPDAKVEYIINYLHGYREP